MYKVGTDNYRRRLAGHYSWLRGAGDDFTLPPGVTLGVTAHTFGGRDGGWTQGTVWILDPNPPPELTSTPFHEECDRAWKNALKAARSALGYIHGSASAAARMPRAIRVGSASVATSATRDGRPCEVIEKRVEGASFGGAFFVSAFTQIVSHLVEETTGASPRTAASFGIDAQGCAFGLTDGVQAKAAALARHAPVVERFVVNVDAQAVTDDDSTPVVAGVESLVRLLDEVTAWKTRLSQAFGDDEWCAESAEVLFADAINNNTRLNHLWNHVHEFGAALRDRLPPDTQAIAREKAELATGIAARWCKKTNAAALRIPSTEFLDSLDRPDREMLLAHLMQSAMRDGLPEPEQVLQLVEPMLAGRVRDLSNNAVKLNGAFGRYLATTGDFDGAWGKAIECLDAWRRRVQYPESTYPLSFAYRLAAASGSTDRFAQLEPHFAWLRLDVPEDAWVWVEVDRAGAALSLGLGGAWLGAELERLCASEAVRSQRRPNVQRLRAIMAGLDAFEAFVSQHGNDETLRLCPVELAMMRGDDDAIVDAELAQVRPLLLAGQRRVLDSLADRRIADRIRAATALF